MELGIFFGTPDTVNSRISAMWSAVPDAPIVIIMFVMFVVHRAEALVGPITKGNPV